MKKTEKHVKFELPHISGNVSEAYRPKFKIDSSLLSGAKIFPHVDFKSSKIPPISSLQCKVRSDIRSITNASYNPSLCTAKLPSSITINRPKRTVISTTDKINPYLTRSKISSATFPLTEITKPSVNCSRISYVDTPISRSTRISLQLTNCHSAYLHAKTPPIDKTRKFSTIYPERCRNFITTNGPMRLSTINTNVSEFDRHLNTKMEMLRSNIPWSKILSVTRPVSAFSDSTVSYGSRLAWVR